MLSLVTGGGLGITRIPFRTGVSHKRQILQKILGEQQKNPKMENRLRRKTRTRARQEKGEAGNEPGRGGENVNICTRQTRWRRCGGGPGGSDGQGDDKNVAVEEREC